MCVGVCAGVHISVSRGDEVSAAHNKRQTDRPRVACHDGDDI